jgi:hypothetical protein
MSVITTFYRLAGTMHGMPVIEEAGLCTDDEVTNLRDHENGRMELNPMPRAAGMTAKALDGGTIKTEDNVGDDYVGKYDHCVQLGVTEFGLAFPVQPFGTYENKAILHYRRTWVQLEA